MLTAADLSAGYQHRLSIWQLEVSRTQVFDRPVQGRHFFEAVIRENLDLGRPDRISLLFPTRLTHRTPAPAHGYRTRVITSGIAPSLHVAYKHTDVKQYFKGERVLRFEAIVHNTRELGCGRVIAKLPLIVARLKAIVDRALRTLQWLDRAFVADATLDQLPTPAQLGKTRVGGIDLGQLRMRTVLAAIMTLALTPRGFTVGEVTAKVQDIGGQAFRDYGVRQAAYDLKKLRAKQLVEKPEHARRYHVPDHGLRTIAALVVLREHVLKPLLAAASHPNASTPLKRKLGRKPKTWSPIDEHYLSLRRTMRALLDDLHLTAA